jgi:hypothetical protein
VRGNSHINGIDSFWGCAKTRLVKFKGMDKKIFNLHLKECKFRFNQRAEDVYQIFLKIFIDEPLKLSLSYIKLSKYDGCKAISVSAL